MCRQISVLEQNVVCVRYTDAWHIRDLQYLVFVDADRINKVAIAPALDKGMIDAPLHQTLIFSKTFNGQFTQFIDRYTNNPDYIFLGSRCAMRMHECETRRL